MRNFNQKFKLRDSDRHIRLLYTLFLFLMLAGFTFSFFWAHSMTELSPQGIADHYRGSDATFGEPAREVYEKDLSGSVYPEARALVDAHLAKGHTVVIVSSAVS